MNWLLLLCLLPAAAFAQATVEGTVTLPKTRAAAPVANKRYEIVSKGGVLSVSPPRAVVYLEGEFARPAAPAVASMEQKNLSFEPGLLPVRAGTRVEFPNLDDTYHDVFSFSPAKRFDLGRFRPDATPTPSQVFDVAGLVSIRCDIHEHMRALILVLDTPHFALTDADGRYRLGNLPAGHYALKAWIDSRTVREHAVDLPKSGSVRVDFP